MTKYRLHVWEKSFYSKVSWAADGDEEWKWVYAVPELREAERSREAEKWSAEAEGQVGTVYHPTRWRPEEPQGTCARHRRWGASLGDQALFTSHYCSNSRAS